VSGFRRIFETATSENPVVSGYRRTFETSTSETPVVSGFSRTRALVLAEEAIRIDPASESLRKVATELQRAADASDPVARSKALEAAATAAAVEAKRAHADAPLSLDAVAPRLSGAFAEALHARLKGSRSSEAPKDSRSGEAPKGSRSGEAPKESRFEGQR
jgi:hypothetical protein